jgi:multidrug efflux pump subunit AcrA (membrane-fusion protein)
MGLIHVGRREAIFFQREPFKLTASWRGILAAGLLIGCGQQKSVELPPPVVTVTAAEQREVKDWDEYTGRLAPLGTVEVRPKVSGYLTEVKFEDGDMVKKGQVLFVIDPRPYQAELDRAQGQYDEADSSLKLATADYDRSKQLHNKGAISAGDFDKTGRILPESSGRIFDGSRGGGSCQT